MGPFHFVTFSDGTVGCYLYPTQIPVGLGQGVGMGCGWKTGITDTVDKVQYIVSHCSIDNGSRDLNYFVLVSA